MTIGHEATVSKIGEEQLFLFDEPGLTRKGHDHGRFGFHRTIGEGTAYGICSRNEPPDPAADGRFCWINL